MKKSGLLVNIKPGTIFKCVHHDATYRLIISDDISIWVWCNPFDKMVEICHNLFIYAENWTKIS